ncbi:MAG: histidine phosphatase family protein [Bacteroidota bacterium]
MKFLVTSILVLLTVLTVQAQDDQQTVLILTRHAEKAKEGGRDPKLSEAGEKRALALDQALKHTPVDVVISTPYIRTRQTVRHVAARNKVVTLEYDYRNPKLLEDLVKEYQGKTILISGHSNTTPVLVNKLLGEERYEQLEETDYGKLFIVTCSAVGKASALIVHYGDPVK